MPGASKEEQLANSTTEGVGSAKFEVLSAQFGPLVPPKLARVFQPMRAGSTQLVCQLRQVLGRLDWMSGPFGFVRVGRRGRVVWGRLQEFNRGALPWSAQAR